MSDATCGVTEADLWDLVEGSQPAESATLRAHVERCPRCSERLRSLEAVCSGLRRVSDLPAIPETIGPYRVTRLIGQGAAGVVYEARQASPARRVAVKLLQPLRQLDGATLRSFRREVRALALLDHPSIATIYDAGQTDDGLPYFAMQLVEGRPIDRYCDELDAAPRDRADLVARLARAVHFAHQRGILHRDLKPAHVLIDAAGDLHVLDFGLARPLDTGADLSLSLSERGVVGTLRYMSPEQARGEAERHDERTDVYAMGVVLYELLTGRVPYELPPGMVGAIEVISGEVPSHPTRVTTAVPRELGDIAMKSLEKEPHRRYATAAALGDDLERFLAGDVVEARPSTTLYQLRVFARRNRALVTASAAVVLVLAVAVVLTSASLVDVRRQRKDAQRATELLASAIEELDPILASEPDPDLRVVVDDLARRVGERGGFGQDSSVEARLQTTIGRAYRHLGELDAAVPHLRRAYTIHRATLLPENEVRLQSAYELGVTLYRVESRGHEWYDVMRSAVDAAPERPTEGSLAMTGLLRGLGVWTARSDAAAARPLLEEAASLGASCAPSTYRDVLWSWALHEVAYLERRESDDVSSLAMHEAALDVRRGLPANHPHVWSSLIHIRTILRRRGDRESQQRVLAISEELATIADSWDHRTNRGFRVRALSRLDELERVCELGLARLNSPEHHVVGAFGVQSGSAGVDPRSTRKAERQTMIQDGGVVVAALEALGRGEEAEALALEIREWLDDWRADELPPTTTDYHRMGLALDRDVGGCMPRPNIRSGAVAYCLSRRFLDLATESKDAADVVPPPWARHWIRGDTSDLQAQVLFGALLDRFGRREEARRLHEAARARVPPELPAAGPRGQGELELMSWHLWTIRARLAVGDIDGALDRAARLRKHAVHRLPSGHAWTGYAALGLAEAHLLRGELDEALPLLDEACATAALRHGSTHCETQDRRALRAHVWRRLGDPGSAHEALEAVRSSLSHSRGHAHHRTLQVRFEIAACLEDLGRADEASRERGEVLRAWRRRYGAEASPADGAWPVRHWSY